jgi:nucleoside phosphorylase
MERSALRESLSTLLGRLESEHHSGKRVVVILTALEHEYRAVRSGLDQASIEVFAHPQADSEYEIGRLSTPSGVWTVILGQIGPHNDTAALEAERAIQYFGPLAILFVGVAGSCKSHELGDIIAVDRAYLYESGKEVLVAAWVTTPQFIQRLMLRFAARTELLSRPISYTASNRLVRLARRATRDKAWWDVVPNPRVPEHPAAYLGAVASGAKVVATRRGETFRLINARYNDALAVDMEGAGFLNAVTRNPHIDGIVVRGISDRLNDKKQAADNIWQPNASRNAAGFAFQLLEMLGAELNV